jgi:HlyD family secretion protein
MLLPGIYRIAQWQQNGLIAQILEDVKEGEKVVNHPSDDVEDGRRVKQTL